MQRTLILSLLAVCPWIAPATTLELTSPNGQVRFQATTDETGHLVYEVRSGGQVRLARAPLGIIIDGTNLGVGATLGEPRIRTLRETFPWRGNKTQATNHCQSAEIPVHAAGGTDWFLEVRVFDGGAAFRYRVPGNGERRVRGEATAWQLPKDARLWLQTNTGDYEGAYHACPADAVPLEEKNQNKATQTYLGPPVTAVYTDGVYGLISEAALYRYSGLTLRPEGEARFRAAFQDDPQGWSHSGIVLSPWRIMILSPDLNGLVNSDLIPALCEAPDPELFPQGINTEWLRPGKGPCTWMVYGNDGAQWHRQKWFVDLCAATGCEYLLVDAGWRSEKWGWLKDGGNLWERAAELCRYAAERKVGIILWHAYPEGRDDSPGLTTVAAREELFRNCQKAGVKGVKVDFFNSESKAVIEAYEDLLRRSAKYQILINFHGANKPTGEARTWPNEITREGIREQEYVLWDSLPLEHYGALPFTRMAVGHADFLPGYVQTRFLKNTTFAFQMAATVVFSSPFLCWPDNPEAYLNSPMLEFVRSVPVTWDETRVLPGSSIGETVIMARRKAEAWYLAVLNCRSDDRQLTVDLSGLDLAGKEMTVCTDGTEKGSCRIESGEKPPAAGKLVIHLKPGGGWLARIRPPKSFTGWK